MPKATSNVDRRRHGRGNNIGTTIGTKSNLQDQRKAGAYTAKTPSANSEFAAGIAAGRPKTQAAPVGKSGGRAAPRTNKIGA